MCYWCAVGWVGCVISGCVLSILQSNALRRGGRGEGFSGGFTFVLGCIAGRLPTIKLLYCARRALCRSGNGRCALFFVSI